ncbi:MAG TPA: sensor histidine kinase [Frankiaceae bacterium]|nr:sensor histidine kinase [Frankiaceae bacterium]
MSQANIAASTEPDLSAQPAQSSRLLRGGLRMVMPLTDLIVAIVGFTLVVVGLTVSLGTLPAFLLGLPLFIAFGFACRGLARLERHRIRLFLGIEIPDVPGPAKGFRGQFVHGPTWRAAGYFLLHFPLGVVTFSVVISVWGAAGSLLAMPWWLHRVPSRRADLGALTVTDQRTAWLLAAAGLLVLVVAALLTYGLTSLEGALARALLGPTSRDLERQVDQLRDSRSRVVDSVDAERRRIERDLHDGAQQRLVAVAMNLGRARSHYDEDPAVARGLLDEAHRDAKQALAELRDLARGIHPAVLTDRGLDAALSGLAGRSPVPVTVSVAAGPRCTPTIEAIAYFVVSEALANIAKHAEASRAAVSVHRRGDRLLVEVTDDGRGGVDASRGSGIAGLRDRVAGVDGTLEVSSPAGGPTTLKAELPCGS